MFTRNKNKPIPEGYKDMICTKCNSKFDKNPEKLTVPGGYLIECTTCGIHTKFNNKDEQEYILGMC